MRKALSPILFLFILYILIRSINFSLHLNFSSDQAIASTKALEIWKNKEVTLVGPEASLGIGGKRILQGSINYYFTLIFLLAGRFDPILSSYFFMLFGVFMLFPLYEGVKNFTNQTIALFVTAIYSFLPYFVDFSRFFFGPNFQVVITPLLIFFMGLYRKNERPLFLFLIFFAAGLLLQFHYQYVIVILILFTFYMSVSKNRFKALAIILLALILGYLPMIIFELKNDFYNARVFFEYLKTTKEGSSFLPIPHRLLSITLILIVLGSFYWKKFITKRLVILTSAALIFLDLLIYLPRPEKAFGMANHWNYLYEKKVYEIVRGENLENYNIVNLGYDTLAQVQKYLHKNDDVKINYDDYYNNKYLFVITDRKTFMDNPAYEVNTFKPSKILKKWQINPYYSLYLLERLK